MRSAQITIKDIAKKLCISPSTVSRALKNHPDISEKTRLAVQKLALELDYKPNAIALSLKKSKSNVIGLIIPEIVHHFFSSVISGIEELAHENGYTIIICQSNENYEREVSNTQTLISNRVEGVIISMTKETTDFKHFINVEKSNIPMVFFDRVCAEIDCDRVIVDDKSAAFTATEYLIKTGCKRICHLSGPENLQISKKRLEGFIEAMNAHGLIIEEDLIINADTYKKGKKAVNKLIKNLNIPDGIFAVNDMTALGALESLKKNNIKIPEQVSVIGFTNGLISTISDPKLSTIEQHGYKMGFAAMKLLLKRINNEEDFPAKTKVIPTKLIIRKSTH